MDEARITDRSLAIEPRTPDLQVQFEQVSVALQQLRQTQASLHDLESRLGDMTRECAGILDRWTTNDEKHATAVAELHGRLSEWNDIERRLLNESTTRIHQFERNLHHEWDAIRQSHEAPLRQLDSDATRIADACLTAVDRALKGFERAEDRLTALEQNLHAEMGTLAREVREAVAEMRQGQLAAPAGPRPSWSLDNVVRLHNELRGDSEPADTAAALTGAPAPAALTLASPARGALALAETPQVDSPAEPNVPTARESRPRARQVPPDLSVTSIPMAAEPVRPIDPSPAPTIPVWRRTPVIATIAGAIVLGGFGMFLQRQMQAGLDQASARAEAAERGANEDRQLARRELDAAQQAADARLESAQRVAAAAQALAAIAAAGDLKRFDLRGDRDLTAQALWSRSQGVAFTSGHLPPVPTGRAYQLWLVGADRAVSAGLVTPGAEGRVSALFDVPAQAPRGIARAVVTVEPPAGSPRPTGPELMSSRIAPPPAVP